MFDPDSCRGGGLNYAKLRRNYLAPPDLFRGSELREIARPKNVNISIETFLDSFKNLFDLSSSQS